MKRFGLWTLVTFTLFLSSGTAWAQKPETPRQVCVKTKMMHVSDNKWLSVTEFPTVTAFDRQHIQVRAMRGCNAIGGTEYGVVVEIDTQIQEDGTILANIMVETRRLYDCGCVACLNTTHKAVKMAIKQGSPIKFPVAIDEDDNTVEWVVMTVQPAMPDGGTVISGGLPPFRQ